MGMVETRVRSNLKVGTGNIDGEGKKGSNFDEDVEKQMIKVIIQIW